MLASQLSVLATQSVTLKWNPSVDPNVAGYRMYYGTASHNYTNIINVGNVTTAVISGLADGTTYYFAATTTDAAGNESDFSNEASFTTAAAVAIIVNQPPSLNDLTNLTIFQNAGFQTIALTGISSGSINEKQVLKVSVATSNPNLIAKPTVNYLSPKSTGSIVLRPFANLVGTSIITVTVNDGGASNYIVTKQFTITVIAPPNPLAPKFTKLITNSIVKIGQTITLSASVAGRAPFKFQWKFKGLNILGATGPTLMLRNIKGDQLGAYTVSVSNPAGSTNGILVLSVAATASVKPAVAAPAINPLATVATLTQLKQGNGQFAFAVAGLAGLKYVVQASSDLKNWSDVQTNTAPFIFTDSNANNFQQRFYRTYYIP